MISITFDKIPNTAALADKLADLSAPMGKAALYMERESKLNFARQSSPEGAAWAATKRGGSILRLTGTLVGSIGVRSVSAAEAIIGAGTNYGIFHQLGTRKMVARPFLGFAARHEEPIRNIFEKYIQGAIA